VPNPPVSTNQTRIPRCAFVALGLIGITIAVYWPVATFEFLNFDDPLYVTDNPHVQHGLNWHNVEWALTTLSASNWHPLTWLSHMLDCQLFGQRPGPVHLVNLALHLANTVLLFLFLNRATSALWRSAFVAALFALHPLHVESVAWIAERKDVLSAFFFFLALLAYVRYASQSKVQGLKSKVTHDASRITFYLLTLFFFTVGLLSKPMLVTLPFVLLLLDYWPFQRLSIETLRRVLLEKFPFFLLSAACSIITFIAQKRGGSVAPVESFPLPDRLANALLAYASYLQKMVWPSGLACFYPLRFGWPGWQIALAATVLLALSVFAWAVRGRLPWFVVGWLWYLGTLVPVIGLVQVGTQSIADRYTYLPFVGLFVTSVWGADELFERLRDRRGERTTVIPAPKQFIRVRFVLAAAVLLGCALATAHQLRYWRNSEVLFTRAIEVCPDAQFSHLDLGHARLLQGRVAEAIPEFQQALRLAPNYALAHVNWANASRLEGQLDEAVKHYLAAIDLQTNYPEAHYACANVLTLQGKFPEAEGHYLEALRQKPDYPQAHINLGNLYELTGRTEQATAEYTKAIESEPDYAEGHYYLGGVLARQMKMREAIAHFRTAIKLDPNYALALNDLAWSLATAEPVELRDLAQAIQFAESACQVTHEKDVSCLDTLATLYAQAGRFPDAQKTASNAVAIARQTGQTAAAAKLETQLAFYRNNQSPPPAPAARAPLTPSFTP
jgi:tetratricopeptide (TPR) repeat protein